MFASHNDLLYVVSAKKDLSWQKFKGIVRYFTQDEVEKVEWELLRDLSALGHCDYHFDYRKSRIYATPPVLARLPWNGLPKAVLSGARSPDILKRLEDYCDRSNSYLHLQIDSQPKSTLLPSRICIEAGSMKDLAILAERFDFKLPTHPSAWSILHFSGSLETYCSNLKWIDNQLPDDNCQYFNISALKFQESQLFQSDSRHKLTKSKDVRDLSIFFLWNEQKRAEVESDWGRLALLSMDGIKNLLVYDESKFILVVPASVPLPKLYQRVLVLCSGYASNVISQRGLNPNYPTLYNFNLYRDVPLVIAALVAQKLGSISSL
jgi:hypothetical protein